MWLADGSSWQVASQRRGCFYDRFCKTYFVNKNISKSSFIEPLLQASCDPLADTGPRKVGVLARTRMSSTQHTVGAGQGWYTAGTHGPPGPFEGGPLAIAGPPSSKNSVPGDTTVLGKNGGTPEARAAPEQSPARTPAPRSYLRHRQRHRRPDAGCWRRRCSGSTRGGRSGPRRSAAPSRTHASYRSSRCRCRPGSGGTPSAWIPGGQRAAGEERHASGLTPRLLESSELNRGDPLGSCLPLISLWALWRGGGAEDPLPAQTPTTPAPRGLLLILHPDRPADNEGGLGGVPSKAGCSGSGGSGVALTEGGIVHKQACPATLTPAMCPRDEGLPGSRVRFPKGCFPHPCPLQ